MTRFDYKRALKGKIAPPWKQANINLEAVELENKKSEYTEGELNRRAIEKNTELRKNLEIYTDGSTIGRHEKGGAGVFIRDSDGVKISEESIAAGAVCSSYTAEARALSKALD